MSIKQLEKSGMQAIKNLRAGKFKLGQPFMINSELLPSDQCYMEYPDGSVIHVKLSRQLNDFKIITAFTPQEGLEIRKKFNLA